MNSTRQIVAEPVPDVDGPETAPALESLPAAPGTRAAEAFALLLLTHFTVDCFASALPTIQPVLAERFGFNLAQAGLLGGFWLFSSSVLQLPFGLLSDRLHSRLFTVLTPVAVAIPLAAMGSAPGIGALIALLLLGGLGVAAYHPHSTSQAGRIAGRRGAIATALFITCGTAGLGFGPLYFTQVIERFGFDRLWLAAIPVALLTPLLLWRMPQPVLNTVATARGVDWHALRGEKNSLLAHYVLVVLRSIVQVGMVHYLSLYMVQVRDAEFKTASAALAIFSVSTSLGSFLGGVATEALGGRNVLLIAYACSAPLLGLFMATEGWVSLLALFLGGTVLLSTLPVHIVMAQRLVPSQAGTTTALMMGFGWGMAGLVFVPLAGWLGDVVGLESVLWALAVLPWAGLPIALAVRPGPRKSRTTSQEPAGD